jgi:N-methylhydantoinase A/oxoprolinase/acetone carboxylase beta subunit
MKLKVVACGVLQPELERLAAESAHEVEVELLEAGLHDRPDLLRERLQDALDQAAGQGYDAVVIGYGLCGRGASGLLARDVPVVIPRAHDCMTLFMGSRGAYRAQFAGNPGTFYITPGWYEHKVRPLGHERERHYEVYEDVTQDPRYPVWADQFGHDRAAYLISFHDSWKRNYSRAAFIDTGLAPGESYEQYAREMAEALGWRYERVPGDPHLLRKMIEGPWEDSEFLVLRPGQRSASSGDEAIFAALDRGSAPATPETAPVAPVEATPPAPVVTAPAALAAPCAALPDGAPVGLGIDAGGTYTDCVLYDLASQTVVAKSKALTTHHHLSLGIDEGLRQLALPDPAAVKLVALSTTLATNSIVEGKGGRPGALIMSPLSGTHSDINWRPLRHLTGAMDIRGEVLAELDPAEIRQAVRDLRAEGVDAFAVSGYASVRNPEHEQQVAAIIREECDLPVVCGHELSSRLDYIARANTAILNARLLSVIRELLEALKSSLAALEVQAPIMVVKGDGSLLNEPTALQRPVETILSGPAASVSGARHLTDVQEGLVFDMGGTTTDSAVVSQGLVRIHPEGATVGGWRTSVEAADIATIGLGGDSHLNFNTDRDLLVGPRRVLPLCALAAECPPVAEEIRRLDPQLLASRSNAGALEFFRTGRDHENAALSDREAAIVEALQAGPLSRAQLARQIGLVEPSLLRTTALENLGFVQRAALTPTDLLHVTGEFRAWDVTAAEQALSVFATLYGATPEEIIARVREIIIRRLCGEVLRHLTGQPPMADEAGAGAALLDLALSPAASGLLQVSLTYTGTLIALGAPVHPFFPEVARRLNARLVIPPHAEVANAIGAIAGEVVVRERAVVRPGELSAYVVHSRAGKREFEELTQALQAAREDVRRLAVERASQSGAAAPLVRLDENHRRGLLADGQQELIEVIIEATAAGRPYFEAAT